MYFPWIALALAHAATRISAATIPMLDLPSLVRAVEPGTNHAVSGSASPAGQGKSIEFKQCDAASDVSAVTISPCTGGEGTLDSPCKMSYGNNYTITITYTSAIDSDRPRSGLAASDKGGEYPSFAYPGQAFDACSFTSCPVEAGVKSVYTYELGTHKIKFDGLTYNVTDWIDGPSIFCATFPVDYSY